MIIPIDYGGAGVYSYIRFSTPEYAKGSSFDRQEAYAAQYAAGHGIELFTNPAR